MSLFEFEQIINRQSCYECRNSVATAQKLVGLLFPYVTVACACLSNNKSNPFSIVSLPCAKSEIRCVVDGLVFYAFSITWLPCSLAVIAFNYMSGRSYTKRNHYTWQQIHDRNSYWVREIKKRTQNECCWYFHIRLHKPHRNITILITLIQMSYATTEWQLAFVRMSDCIWTAVIGN